LAILPEIQDRAHYSELFKESHHWAAAVDFIKAKHGLTGLPERAVLGSHIVYKVGEVWIKMMAPLFAKDMAFEISGLRAVYGRLSVPTPQIVAEGNVDGWSYIILTHVQGSPLRDRWKMLGPSERVALAGQIAQITKEIARCSPDMTIQKRFVWNNFIVGQYENYESQQLKKSLPDKWRATLGAFLKSFDSSEFKTTTPVFLHADLTSDHFLVSEGEGGKPQVTGIIDMADCQVGNYEYELVAPCTFIFKSDKATLREFLLGCGFQEKNMNQRFSEKLLAWSVLHRYFSLVSYFKDEMAEVQPGDFPGLAARVFPLE
jgi:hygromycin-B 7''-O-kinase